MHEWPNEVHMADWVREYFGIKDEDELRVLLADPTQMLALLDVAQAAGDEEMPVIAKSPDPYAV